MKRATAIHERAPHVASEKSETVLLLVDVINDFDFPQSGRLVRATSPMVSKLARLKERAAKRRIACVYVNDNFGRWRSDLHTLVDHVREKAGPGRALVDAIGPTDDDYFVLKPQNSGFYSTALETLLKRLEASTLIITGLTSDNCILFTAQDAYLRGFRLFVPRDCCVAETPALHAHALTLIERSLKADLRESTSIHFASRGKAIR